MPHGFFTVEQWARPTARARGRWMEVFHVDGGRTLSDAIAELEKLGKPGFYRVTQTQRMIWAEREGGKLRLRKWHVGSPDNLASTAEAFERDGGKWPVKKAREETRKKRRQGGASGKIRR